MITKVRLVDQLKLDANLNKRKRRIFVINLGRNFGSDFAIFMRNLLNRHFRLFSFFLF